MSKEFKHYFKLLRSLIEELPLDHVVYAEGSTVGQIAFHAAQSSNNFIRAHVLRLPFERDKDREYSEEHSLAEILKSIDTGIEGCDLLEEHNPKMDEKILKPFEIKSGNFTVETNLDALSFGLGHLAQHYGELTQVKRELAKSS